MEKYTDATLSETSSEGIYTQLDIFNLESIEKIKHATDLTIFCNRICFKDYKFEMREAENECH